MLTFKENIEAYFSVEDKNQFQGFVASNNFYSRLYLVTSFLKQI